MGRGNTKSRLDTTLGDEAWRQVRPHQRTPVKFALLGLLLNNKTALDNTQAVEAKLEKELLA